MNDRQRLLAALLWRHLTVDNFTGMNFPHDGLGVGGNSLITRTPTSRELATRLATDVEFELVGYLEASAAREVAVAVLGVGSPWLGVVTDGVMLAISEVSPAQTSTSYRRDAAIAASAALLVMWLLRS